MIRLCKEEEFDQMLEIINEAAEAYRGVIPEDRWKEPYMPVEELLEEIAAGVVFWGFEAEGQLVGVMGIQDVRDVTLIRHAYVRKSCQGRGIGGKLLARLSEQVSRPLLIGTWKDAYWAVGFYKKHGFVEIQPEEEKNRLLRAYWTIPDRQVETSVVLADERFFKNPGRVH